MTYVSFALESDFEVLGTFPGPQNEVLRFAEHSYHIKGCTTLLTVPYAVRLLCLLYLALLLTTYYILLTPYYSPVAAAASCAAREA